MIALLSAGVFLAAWQLPAAADGSPAPQSAAKASSAPSANLRELLGPGDKLSVVVFEQPDISGTYMVELNNTIMLPLIGPVDVSGLTPNTLQELLTSRFGDGYLQNPLISVRLAEYRPVTIIGNVRSPGRYTYIEGMDVSTLAELAGGAVQLNESAAKQRIDFLQTDTQLKTLKLQYLSQLARKARLEAQRDGKPIVTPKVAPDEEAAMAQLVEGETSLMQSATTSLAHQAAVLAEEKRQAEANVQAFSDQMDQQRQQVASYDKQISYYQGLFSHGLASRSILLDIQRERFKTQSDLAGLLGNLVQSKSRVSEIELQSRDLDDSFKAKILADIQETNIQIDQSRATLPLLTEQRRIMMAQMPKTTQASAAGNVVEIRRYGNGRFVTMTGGPDTEILPGDIVKLGNTPSDAYDAVSASPARPDAQAASAGSVVADSAMTDTRARAPR